MLKGAIVKVIRSGKTFNRYRELVESEFPQMLDSWRNGGFALRTESVVCL